MKKIDKILDGLKVDVDNFPPERLLKCLKVLSYRWEHLSPEELFGSLEDDDPILVLLMTAGVFGSAIAKHLDLNPGELSAAVRDQRMTIPEMVDFIETKYRLVKKNV